MKKLITVSIFGLFVFLMHSQAFAGSRAEVFVGGTGIGYSVIGNYAHYGDRFGGFYSSYYGRGYGGYYNYYGGYYYPNRHIFSYGGYGYKPWKQRHGTRHHFRGHNNHNRRGHGHFRNHGHGGHQKHHGRSHHGRGHSSRGHGHGRH